MLHTEIAEITDQWMIELETSGPQQNHDSISSAGVRIEPLVMVADNPHFSQGDVSALGCYRGGPAGGRTVVRNWIEKKAEMEPG